MSLVLCLCSLSPDLRPLSQCFLRTWLSKPLVVFRFFELFRSRLTSKFAIFTTKYFCKNSKFKKGYQKKWQKNGVFDFGIMCAKVSANNFFGSIVLHFFKQIRIHHRLLHFMIPISIFLEYFLPISLFATFIANDGRNGPRKRKTFFINVPQKPILHPFLYWGAPFGQKKVKIIVP